VGVRERRVGVLRGHDLRHDALCHALVGALQAREIDEADGDDRGREGEDRTEGEAELDGEAHVPEAGRAAGGRKTHAL
jgi:hypothetical protein